MTRIPYSRKTELVEARVKQIRGRTDDAIEAFKRDGGGMLGDKNPPANVRLEKYWQSVTLPDGSIDMHDVSLIMPDAQGRYVTELLLRNGVSSDVPHSPVWLNFLRIDGMFTEKAKDFVRLNEADLKRREQGGGSEPVTSGAGFSPPQMAAAVPAQPPAGGGAGGYCPPQPGMMP